MELASDAFEARLQQALVAFRAIPPKPAKPSSERKQAVAMLFDEITRLKTQGYDFEELREFVIEHAEVEMSVGTLRKYWSAERRKRQGKKPQQKRSGKPKRTKKASSIKEAQLGKAEQKETANSPEPTVTVNPVTPDDDSGDTWPPVEDRGSDSPSDSDPEPPTEQPEPKSNDDYWNDGGWEDDNPPAGGLLNERKFNVIKRD